MTKKTGWIGYWSPGIGDPTAVGWATVALYAAAAVACYAVARRLQKQRSPEHNLARERLSWRMVALVLAFFCLNKQLDLQTAMTELGRMLAHYQNWYEKRYIVQKAFIALIALSGAIILSFLSVVTWRLSRSVRVAMVGLCFLGSFVLIRAGSFHHVDVMLGKRLFSAKWNWVLELGSTSIVLFAACARLFFQSDEASTVD